MRNDDEFTSSRDRQYQTKKSSSRKRDEKSEERIDLRNRLNELKKGKDKSSDRETKSSSGVSHHRTKQVHDYEPYHKSSVTISTTNNKTDSLSHKNIQRRRNYSPEKDRATSFKYDQTEMSRRNSSKPDKPSKPVNEIKDAEVNEIISEDEKSSEESDAAVSESSKNRDASQNSGSCSPKRIEEGTSSPIRSDNSLSEEEEDMDSREAIMKAKLKESFLKSQLDKKLKDSKSRIPDSSADKELKTVEEKRIEDAKTDDEMNGVDKEETGSETSTTDSDGSKSDVRKAKAIKSRDIVYKKRKGSAGSASNDGSMSESEGEFTPNSTEASNRKKQRRSRSNSGSRKSGRETAMIDHQQRETVVEDKKMEEELIQAPPPPPPIMYYCATQGCRSVEEFECLNKIEEGAYGVVYRAKDKKSNVVVALKRLKMEKEREGFPITSIREVDTLLKSQHMNVVTVREIVVGSNMDKIYMVMDYVEHDLKSLMQNSMKKPFQMSEVKCLTKQMLSGIAHLHDNWIIHRDLKTSNLLLSHKGVLKIADFGLAREYGSPLKEYTPVVVTLWYRCPELLLNAKKYSTSVDMWSAGTIFAELMLLKALFPGKNEKDQLDKIFKDLGTPNEKIWPGFSDLPLAKQLQFPNFPYNTLRSRFGKYLSENGFELINKLLTYDPARRISAEDALKHDFFKESPLPIDPSLFPTWPAKSEGLSFKAKKVADSEPRAPSAGKMYDQLLQDDNSFVLQFPAQSGGFTLR